MKGRHFAFTVHDNEATTLAVSAPSTAMEEAGTIAGNLISVPVTATAVTVGLVSSRRRGLQYLPLW